MRTELKENEEIIFTTQKHWKVLILPFIIASIILIISISLLFGKSNGGLFYIILCSGTIIYGIYKFYSWKYYMWVVTNQRVIEEYGVFSFYSKESPLEKINNITYRQPFIGKIFNFGDIEIQTAAKKGSTIYYDVVNPIAVRDSIVDAMESKKVADYHKQAFAFANPMNEANLDDREDTKICPYCAETIKAKARICRYCNREV
ncbi:MAG: PH domain-containing protein [Ignavibacteria bacterium]|jgi:uncharacterized membrane protein YdbT with pleckstrin-like domain|nr:PH domain-containing protein [Ignavibacteria bacterium]MCU7511074.1 PH domain-containing protein [Ignavibacteria bacterium]MCU7518621.1 PH domain-containing protein [Ignavibacteria bacterium]